MFERVYKRASLYVGRMLTLRLDDLAREEGQGVTEYGLAVAFVAIALGAVLFVLSGAISGFLSTVGDDLSSIPASL